MVENQRLPEKVAQVRGIELEDGHFKLSGQAVIIG
jgi:hypothetical protein